jgi:hypothetical protein
MSIDGATFGVTMAKVPPSMTSELYAIELDNTYGIQ